jgi:S-DNA-T family DNA segregation ATPase FtsK/SpoIIIE
MAKQKTKSKKTTKKKLKAPSFKLSNQQKLIFGSLLVILGVVLCISFVSYFFTGDVDQSTLSELSSRDIKAKNWLSKLGAWLSDFFIHKGFRLASFIFSGLFFLSGVYILMNLPKAKLGKHWFWGTLIVIWLSIFFGFFAEKNDMLGGIIGYEINAYLQDYIGKIGTSFLLLFGLITYLAVRFGVTFESIIKLFTSTKKNIRKEFSDLKEDPIISVDNNLSDEAEAIKSAYEVSLDNQTELP